MRHFDFVRMPMTADPLILNNIALAGRHVRLEPFDETLREPVRAALDCDPDAWRLFAINWQGADFDAFWRALNGQVAQGGWIAYAIRHAATGAIVGTTSFLNIKPTRQTVEIGGTFVHPDARATLVNAEAKYLMLAHAFAAGMRRVELLTDARNVRSQAAIARLGAVREGVLRRERVTWTGHVRDSVLFAVTDLDWPDVRARLERRLGAAGPA
jgi:RimJ/RimL family protein N-acetyltransferase